MIAPKEIKSLIIEAFTDDVHPAYGQIATVNQEGRARVRTVHLHYIKQVDAIVFNTHIQSRKWEELSDNPYVSGCYFDLFRSIQFRFEAKVQLIAPKNHEHTSLLDLLWLKMREEVRRAYWLDSLNKSIRDSLPKNISLHQRAPNLGSMICMPYQWHIYETPAEDFTKGKATLYTQKNGRWQTQKVDLLHY
ncbi:MAG: pyridoxamine 5'-phosphate oxidase family protein [Deltaproteobacteria bacterium]|nr:pyridoxamine 5'-phosphate oxidase family protein [Deltaproteobacteria bacterium]